MKNLIILLIIISGLKQVLISQVNNPKFEKVYTLAECRNIALEKNRNINSSMQRSLGATAKYDEAKTTQLPSLKFQGSYARLSDIPPFEVTLPAPINRTFSISPVILDNYNLKLSLQQPLFTGFKIQAAKDMAEYNMESSLEDYNKDKLELIFNVNNAYLNIQKLKVISGLIKENIKQIESHLYDVNNFFKQGMMEKNDVLKTEVQLSNVKLSLIDCENNLKIAKMNMCSLMGINLTSDFDVTDFTGIEKIETGSLEQQLNLGLTNRNDLKSMEKKVKMSESNITLAKSNWYPQIFLAGNYTYANPNQRLMPAKDEFKDTWDVSVSLSFDIWNWGANSAKIDQAIAQSSETNNGYQLVKDMISLEINQCYLNLEQLNEKLLLTQKTIEQSEENHRLSKDKFSKGLLSNSELLDAEVLLLQSKINHIQAQIEYQIAYARLEKSTGKLK
jgi:outer membrane protein